MRRLPVLLVAVVVTTLLVLFFDAAQLRAAAKPLAKNEYGQYLLRLLEDRVF